MATYKCNLKLPASMQKFSRNPCPQFGSFNLSILNEPRFSLRPPRGPQFAQLFA